MRGDTRLLIVQAYLPKYRIPFFEQLISELALDGIDCRVTAAMTTVSHAKRQDSGTAPWIIPTVRHRVRAFGRSCGTLGSTPARRGATAVIVGLQGSQIDTYRAIAERKTAKRQVGVWGHIRSYVNDPSPVDERLERWQARHADHVFAYTPSGSRHAEKYGVATDRITTVMNSVDVSATLAAMDQLGDDDLASFQREHSIDPTNAACFIGGLDQAKRVGFLQEALDHVWHQDRNFKLLVGGNGIDAELLASSVARGQVVMLGFAGPEKKALLARSSTVLAMPGRIGLVAVESLALGLPIVTTDWPYHAPEAEYLDEGTSRFTAQNDPRSYAQLLLQQVVAHANTPRPEFDYPRLDDMVGNFRRGVLQMLA